jgi:hypothetical protein
VLGGQGNVCNVTGMPQVGPAGWPVAYICFSINHVSGREAQDTLILWNTQKTMTGAA